MFLPAAWLLLTRVALRGSLSDFRGAEKALGEEKKSLGAISRPELYVLRVFMAAVVGWVTRSTIDIGSVRVKGWESILGLEGMVHDATVAIAAAIALFMIPVSGRKETILDWRTAKDIPWGILVLFGGGIALGSSILESGLATKVASSISALGRVPTLFMIVVSAALVSGLTEITSNTAIATIMLPVLASTALGMSIHPFALMIPAAISASCAFMMPVATPPNAIVYSTGAIPISGMVRIGLMMNVLGVLIVALLMYIFADPVLGGIFAGLPGWAVP